MWLEIKILWKQSIQTTGIAVICSSLTLLLSEMILTLLIYITLPEIGSFSSVWIFCFQITLSLFTVLLFKIFSFETLYQKVVSYLEYKKVTLWFLLIFLVLSIIQFHLRQKQISILSLFFIVVLFLLITEYIKEKLKKEKLIDEYETLLHMTEKFENILLEKNKLNQEYRNQLMILRQMIKTSPNVEAYIEQIYQDSASYNIDVFILKEVEKITSNGGLKGLFYYKIKTLFDKEIKVTLDIDDKVRKTCDLIQNENYKCLTQALGCMFDYSKFLLQESHVKQMSITMYTDQKHLYVAFTHPIGENNLPFTSENEYHFFLKDLLQRHLNFKRNETILDGIYTQTLEIRI